MANTFVPFDHNPVGTQILDNASYTVPAGKYARISVLAARSGDAILNYDLDGAASTVDISGIEVVNTAPTTNNTGFVTLYTVPAGFWFEGQIQASNSTTANQSAFKVGSGIEVLSPRVTGSAAADFPFTFVAGPGTAFQGRSLNGANMTLHINGVLRSNSKSDGFWLKAGDQITFPGVVLIQEYNIPS